MLIAGLLLIAASRVRAEELFRFRVTNETGGPIELSLDGGNGYSAIGQVLKPAVAAIASFGAAAYMPNSSIAATAVHGLRIKVGQSNDGQPPTAPMTVSIVPQEFSRIPKGFGGHDTSASGIYTDIPSGTAIFRAFAPFAGSRVYLQRDGVLRALEANYRPRKGDVLVVIVQRPDKWPAWIEFENRAGGAVTTVYPDGTKEQITTVVKPVSGVGRYDGTSYTGVGLINTNHGGVITVSTAPISDSPLLEGDGSERRGGFMIQPSYHAGVQGGFVPQVMVVGPEGAAAMELEGKPPLFYGCIGLAYDPLDSENTYRAQIRVDDGEWEDLPPMVGRIDDAFEPAKLSVCLAKLGRRRTVKTGVTHIRLMFPRLDSKFLQAQADRCRTLYSAKVLNTTHGEPVSGELTINAVVRRKGRVAYVHIRIDGEPAGMSNLMTYSYSWDTTNAPDGTHTIEVRGVDEVGNIVVSKKTRVVVKNKKK